MNFPTFLRTGEIKQLLERGINEEIILYEDPGLPLPIGWLDHIKKGAILGKWSLSIASNTTHVFSDWYGDLLTLQEYISSTETQNAYVFLSSPLITVDVGKRTEKRISDTLQIYKKKGPQGLLDTVTPYLPDILTNSGYDQFAERTTDPQKVAIQAYGVSTNVMRWALAGLKRVHARVKNERGEWQWGYITAVAFCIGAAIPTSYISRGTKNVPSYVGMWNGIGDLTLNPVAAIGEGARGLVDMARYFCPTRVHWDEFDVYLTPEQTDAYYLFNGFKADNLENLVNFTMVFSGFIFNLTSEEYGKYPREILPWQGAALEGKGSISKSEDLLSTYATYIAEKLAEVKRTKDFTQVLETVDIMCRSIAVGNVRNNFTAEMNACTNLEAGQLALMATEVLTLHSIWNSATRTPIDWFNQGFYKDTFGKNYKETIGDAVQALFTKIHEKLSSKLTTLTDPALYQPIMKLYKAALSGTIPDVETTAFLGTLFGGFFGASSFVQLCRVFLLKKGMTPIDVILFLVSGVTVTSYFQVVTYLLNNPAYLYLNYGIPVISQATLNMLGCRIMEYILTRLTHVVSGRVLIRGSLMERADRVNQALGICHIIYKQYGETASCFSADVLRTLERMSTDFGQLNCEEFPKSMTAFGPIFTETYLETLVGYFNLQGKLNDNKFIGVTGKDGKTIRVINSHPNDFPKMASNYKIHPYLIFDHVENPTCPMETLSILNNLYTLIGVATSQNTVIGNYNGVFWEFTDWNSQGMKEPTRIGKRLKFYNYIKRSSNSRPVQISLYRRTISPDEFNPTKIFDHQCALLARKLRAPPHGLNCTYDLSFHDMENKRCEFSVVLRSVMPDKKIDFKNLLLQFKEHIINQLPLDAWGLSPTDLRRNDIIRKDVKILDTFSDRAILFRLMAYTLCTDITLLDQYGTTRVITATALHASDPKKAFAFVNKFQHGQGLTRKHILIGVINPVLFIDQPHFLCTTKKCDTDKEEHFCSDFTTGRI